jgi:cytidylate kinase
MQDFLYLSKDISCSWTINSLECFHSILLQMIPGLSGAVWQKTNTMQNDLLHDPTFHWAVGLGTTRLLFKRGKIMPIITVSRGSMSGGKTLAECISGTLRIPCLGREILVNAAAKLGVPEEVLAKKMEQGPGLWDRLTLERRIYVVAVQASLAEEIINGDLVYHGLAGQLLLRNAPAVLRVRLIAPIESRIRTVMEHQGLSRQAADQYIKDVDENRIRWTRFIYGVDLQNPQIYDVLINLEKMSIPSACDIVVEAAKKPEFQITEKVRTELADFALACRVKVMLATHPASRGLDLEVTARGGDIRISGEVPKPVMLTHASSRWENELTHISKSVDGVRMVELSIQPFDAYH